MGFVTFNNNNNNNNEIYIALIHRCSKRLMKHFLWFFTMHTNICKCTTFV